MQLILVTVTLSLSLMLPLVYPEDVILRIVQYLNIHLSCFCLEYKLLNISSVFCFVSPHRQQNVFVFSPSFPFIYSTCVHKPKTTYLIPHFRFILLVSFFFFFVFPFIRHSSPSPSPFPLYLRYVSTQLSITYTATACYRVWYLLCTIILIAQYSIEYFLIYEYIYILVGLLVFTAPHPSE